MIDAAAIKSRFDPLHRSWTSGNGDCLPRAKHERRCGGRPGSRAVPIDRGLADLRTGAEPRGTRVRRPGGGSKPATETQPGLLAALHDLVQSSIRGDPEAALLWISKSQRHLAAALAERGLLRRLGLSLQANSKTREGASHPDRNAQFEHINAAVTDFQAAGEPAISVDTKKKELVGDFKNHSRELRPQGDPEPVRVHDFKIPELGKVAPYGVYTTSPPTEVNWISFTARLPKSAAIGHALELR